MKRRIKELFLLQAVFFLFFMCMKSTAFAEGKGKITTRSEKVYESMSLESDILENVISGMRFDILAVEQDEEENTWYLVHTQSGTLGYMQAQNVAFIPYVEYVSEEQYVKSTEKINIRESYSTDSAVLGSLPKNKEVRVLAICGNEIGETWYQISYQDITGFVRNTLVEICETQESEFVEQNNQENVMEQKVQTKTEITKTTEEAVTQKNEIENKEMEIDAVEQNEISTFGLVLIVGCIVCVFLGLILTIRVISISKNTGEKRKGK